MIKKILYPFVIIICFLIYAPNVSAFGTSISGKTSILSGEEVTLTFSVTNATNLMGILARLNYDSSKLSVVSHSGLNQYNITLGTNIVADHTVGKSGSFGFATVKFRALSGFAIGQNTTISLTNVTGSDGTDFSGTGSSLTINMTAPKSSNNNLSNLTIDGRQINGFSATKTSYSLTVENSKTSVAIGATAADSKSSISGTGTKSLKIYQNSFNIVVTAENGSKKTYTINITRKDGSGLTAPLDTNSNLKTVTIENFALDFKSDIYEYNLVVEDDFIDLNITAIAESSKAKIDINAPKTLITGINKIVITVTAENNSKQTYTFNITRTDNIPNLTISEIYEKISMISSDTINVNVHDETLIIDMELFALLFEHKKDLTVSYYRDAKLIYKWKLKGDNPEGPAIVNTKLNFNHNEEIDLLTNFVHKLFLNFEHTGVFPNNTNIIIYVGDNYADDVLLNLYYFHSDSEEIELIKKDLKVENGFVSLDIEHASSYFLTRADLTPSPTSAPEAPMSYVIYIIAIIFIITIVAQSVFIFKLIKRRKD